MFFFTDHGPPAIPFAAVLLILAGAPLSAPAAAPTVAIRSVLRIVNGPSLQDSFRRPLSIATDEQRGLIIVADTGHQRLAIFDARGRARGVISTRQRRPGQKYSEPRAVAVDAHGRLYVADSLNRSVEAMSSYGASLAFLAIPLDEETRRLTQPQFVTVGASGRIYILLSGSRRGLVAMERDGTLVTRIGFEPQAEATLRGPVAVAVNAAENRIAIVDPEAEQAVLIYDAAGRRLVAFGPHGNGDGTFSMAIHATWGPGDTIWVTDTIRHSISVFDDQGHYAGRIGGFGHGPGQFNYPAGCAFLAPDQLVVLERAAARFQVLDLDIELSAPEAPPGAAVGSGQAGTGATTQDSRR